MREYLVDLTIKLKIQADNKRDLGYKIGEVTKRALTINGTENVDPRVKYLDYKYYQRHITKGEK